METKYAWAAGFTDGEGYISIKKSKRWYALCVDYSQKYSEPLVELQSLFGGALQELAPRKSDNRVYWRLTLGPKAAEHALQKMLPYLVTKKKQAEVALEYQSRRNGLGRIPVKDAQADLDNYLTLKGLHQ